MTYSQQVQPQAAYRHSSALFWVSVRVFVLHTLRASAAISVRHIKQLKKIFVTNFLHGGCCVFQTINVCEKLPNFYFLS
jgi:hypothetical protein